MDGIDEMYVWSKPNYQEVTFKGANRARNCKKLPSKVELLHMCPINVDVPQLLHQTHTHNHNGTLMFKFLKNWHLVYAVFDLIIF